MRLTKAWFCNTQWIYSNYYNTERRIKEYSATKMAAVCQTETLVSTYESTRHINTEEQHRHFYRPNNLESRMLTTNFTGNKQELVKKKNTRPNFQIIQPKPQRLEMNREEKCHFHSRAVTDRRARTHTHELITVWPRTGNQGKRV